MRHPLGCRVLLVYIRLLAAKLRSFIQISKDIRDFIRCRRAWSRLRIRLFWSRLEPSAICPQVADGSSARQKRFVRVSRTTCPCLANITSATHGQMAVIPAVSLIIFEKFCYFSLVKASHLSLESLNFPHSIVFRRQDASGLGGGVNLKKCKSLNKLSNGQNVVSR